MGFGSLKKRSKLHYSSKNLTGYYSFREKTTRKKIKQTDQINIIILIFTTTFTTTGIYCSANYA